MAVSTPRRRMLMHTPAKGSPVRWRTKRMSPSLAHSGFRRSKRRVRAPVGSRVLSEFAVMVWTGRGQVFLIAGAGLTMLRPWVLPGGVWVSLGKLVMQRECCGLYLCSRMVRLLRAEG